MVGTSCRLSYNSGRAAARPYLLHKEILALRFAAVMAA